MDLLPIFIIVAFVVGWSILLWLAAVVAPQDRVTTFVWITAVFGPLGILAAAVASPRDPSYFDPEPRPIVQGRTRYRCARCGAESDLPEPKGFSCWRCSEKKYMVAES